MRVALLGGTRFIGVAIVEELLAHGHDVIVVHRGGTETDDAPDVPHVHIDRHHVAGLKDALRTQRVEALIDTCAFDAADAIDALAAIAPDVTRVVLSSIDVYRAFATLRAGGAETDAVPLDEDAAVRAGEGLYPYRGLPPYPGSGVENTDTYEKLDVEREYLARGSCVLRLPMVYGPRDPKRREDFVLRRVRAGRGRIPVGAGSLLWSRVGVRDAARAVRLATEAGERAHGVFNVAESSCWTIDGWVRRILECAGSSADLVRVDDAVLPEDMALTGHYSQHALVDSRRAWTAFGWRAGDPMDALRDSVAWHLAHPPSDVRDDFRSDAAALASRVTSTEGGA